MNKNNFPVHSKLLATESQSRSGNTKAVCDAQDWEDYFCDPYCLKFSAIMSIASAKNSLLE